MSRKGFKQWKVEVVYEAQEGICGKIGCNRPLSHGFQRHHKDGNPENDSLDNLELWCPKCHYASFTGAKKDEYERHKKQEAKTLKNINKLISLAFGGKLSGAHMERLIDAMQLGLRTSRHMAGLDAELESVPPSIALTIRLQEMKELQKTFLEGLKEGVSLGATIAKGVK